MAVENLFIADFYRTINPDLANFSNSQGLSHFEQYGLTEGRRFSPYVDLPLHYRANNPDLSALNNSQLFEHLKSTGIAEGRKFSPLVDLDYYRLNRANPSNLRSLNYSQAFEDLRNTGLNEGRNFSPYVNLNLYKKLNPDLDNLSFSQAFEHLQTNGFREGRLFDDIVDLGVYLNENPDIARGYGGDRYLALEHLERNGLDERRKFSRFFDTHYYRSQNADLAAAGFTGKQLFNHFEIYGIYEGRAGRPDIAGNTQDSALTINNVTSGSQHFFDNVGTSDGEDYYRFTLNEPKKFSIFAESFGTPVNAEFLSDDGRILTDLKNIPNRPGHGDLNLQLVPGTYYLRFRPTGGGNANYSFVISPS